MMKIANKKRCWIAGALILSMIGVTGCMSKDMANQLALKKFEEKYGVDYEVIYKEEIGDSVEKRDEIHVYVEGMMEEGESAIIYSWVEDGEAVSRDSLFGYIIREDYEEAVKAAVEQQFTDVKVYVDFADRSFDDVLVQGSTLEDAYAVGQKVVPYIDIIVVSEDDEDIFASKGDEICSALKDAQLFGTINIFALPRDVYEQMNRMEYHDTVSLSGYKQYDGKILEVYSGTSFES